MGSWVVIRTGGKQYKVAQGQSLDVEKLESKEGDLVKFNEVLLVSSNGDLIVGRPLVEKASVKARVVSNFRDKKIRVVKYKSKSRYTRTTGHRQAKTKISIEKIEN